MVIRKCPDKTTTATTENTRLRIDASSSKNLTLETEVASFVREPDESNYKAQQWIALWSDISLFISCILNYARMPNRSYL